MTEIERARRAFLLAVCEDDTVGEYVHRAYLAEKVIAIYRDETVAHIRGRLDLRRQRYFDTFFAESV